MPNCLYCNKKISISKVFCSKSCKENYFHLMSISIPKPFLKRLYFFCNEEEKEKAIIEFSQRHKWRVDLVKNKIKEEATKIGYAV